MDAERGLMTPSAGVEIAGVDEGDPLELDLGVEENLDAFTRRGVNVLHRCLGGANLVTAVTMAIDEDWQDIALRRFVQFVMASIECGTRWVVFEPHSEATWKLLAARIADFLEMLWKRGLFGAGRARESYFVLCDRRTQTQNDIDNGRMIAVIGFVLPQRGAVSLEMVRQLPPADPVVAEHFRQPEFSVWRIQARGSLGGQEGPGKVASLEC
jgi:phage tail sheath protein FI